MISLITGLTLLLSSSCSKNESDWMQVSDSIYGTYVYSNPDSQTGGWTDILVGTIIKVKPGNPPFFTITLSGVMGSPTVFDSVVLGPNNTFSVDRYITNSFSSAGTSHLVGTGNFPKKKISMNFEMIHQTNPLVHTIYKIPPTSKISNDYN